MNASITILTDTAVAAAESDGPETGADNLFDAEVLLLEQPLMRLVAMRPVAVGGAIRIDMSDAVWFGEVEECVTGGGAGGAESYSIRVRLRHVLRDFETLARLAERFGSSVPKRRIAEQETEHAAKGVPVQI
jgi:hypothetical protein